jgi:hypothetical protein
MESSLTVTNNQLQAKDWLGNPGANVSSDGNTISWDNGTIWTRLPSSASELEKRIAYWESQTFYCPSPAGAFPSKEGDKGSCDDGDSVMFNALLCREGDPRGCNAVKLSQDDYGRFWRSPKRRMLGQKEPSAADDALALLQKRDLQETTFSGDHAQGLFLYFGHTGDKAAFQRWIDWIDQNARCTTFCGLMPPVTTPRYCQNDRCAFRVGDCQTLLLLARKLGAKVPFCSMTTPIPDIPDFTSTAVALKNTYDATLGKLPVQPPGLKLLRDNFENLLEAYQGAVAPIEKLRTQIEAEAVRAAALVQIEKTVSELVAARGFSRHNGLVQIMMLQDWGLGKSWMSKVAERIAADEPLNPFFQYVAHRRESKASMLPLILPECPSEATDQPHLRSQWAWERDSNGKAWLNTMYWDCLYIGAAYLDPGGTPKDDDSSETALRQLLDQAIAAASAAQAAAEAALKPITDLANNPVAAVGAEVQKNIDDVKDVAEHPDQAAKHPGETIEKLNPDTFREKAKQTIKKYCSFC